MAKEVAELTIKANVAGAKKEFDSLNKSIKENITEYQELTENVEVQNEVINKLELSLIELKRQQTVNSDYVNGLEKMTDRIAATELELKKEKIALKSLNADRKKAAATIKSVEQAQRKQVKQAFRGIQHFNIMGVSLRRIRLMVRGIIPGFKLMFRTIKVGMASTGIGVLVVILGSLITSMMTTVKGASFLKAQLKVIGAVVKTLLKPFQLLGDAILGLFGVTGEETLTSAQKLEQTLGRLNEEMEKINQQEVKIQGSREKSNRQIADLTKTEEERLQIARDQNALDVQHMDDTEANLLKQKRAFEVALADSKSWAAHEKKRWKDGKNNTEGVKMSTERLNKQTKEYNKLLIEIQKLENKRQSTTFAFEDQIKDIKQFNIDKETESQSELAAKQKKWRDDRKKGEEKIGQIILKLNQEIEIAGLETTQEVEKKKLENKMEKMKEDILKSKASKKTKDEALLLLEEDYQNDLQAITDKFDDKADAKAEKEAQTLAELRNENTINELDDEREKQLKLLEIQKEAELEKLKEYDNFTELKIEIDEKYKSKTDEIEEKAEKEQKARDKAVVDVKRQMGMQGLQLIEGFAGEGSKVAKAAAVAQATIAGTESVIQAFKTASQSPLNAVIPGYNFAQAGLAAGFSALQIKKIIAGEGPSEGGGGGGQEEITANTPSPELLSGAFSLEGANAPEPLRAYVVTDEMTDSQNQLANIRRRATI